MKRPKRRLIVSFIFDCGYARNSMYVPSVSYYWIVGEKENPIRMHVGYAWQDFDVNYTYEQFMNLKSLVGNAKYQIEKRVNNYEGDFCIDMDEHYFLSSFGQSVHASSSQKQVEGWIDKWIRETSSCVPK